MKANVKMKKILLNIIILLCVSLGTAFAGELTPSHLKALKPRLSEFKSKILTDHFNRIGTQYSIDPAILAAIAFQESSFKFSVISGNDIGLFQLNYYWQIVKKGRINEYSIEQLSEDWHLNTKLAAEHLDDCKTNHPKDSLFPWWVCFHSRNYKYQKIYNSRISKHLKKLEAVK